LASAKELPGAALWLCAGVALYLYVNLFLFPRVPILLSGDQVFFWMNGQRMLNGELPYRDFFQFTPPGIDLLYFSVFKILGVHIWVTNTVVLALGIALCWLCFSVATQIMEFKLALPATLLFLTLIYTKLLNATHHWFSVFLILCAVRMLLQGQSRMRVFTAGALLGLAGFFTQSHAAAALLAFTIWLSWQKFRQSADWPTLFANELCLVVGFLIALGGAESYFAAAAGWKQLWYFQFTYVLKYMVHGPESSFLGMPDWMGWKHLPGAAQYITVYLMLPIIYVLALARCWGKEYSEATSSEQNSKTTLLALTGAALLFEVLFSLSWLRVYAVSMPGLILLLWLVGQARRMRVAAFRVIWIGIFFLGATQGFSAHHREYVIAKLPGGWAAVNPEAYQKLHWVEVHTRPEEFFFQAAWPGVYVPLRLRNPVFADALGLNTATRPEFVEQSIAQLDARVVHYILWSQRLNAPGNHEPPTSSLAPLRAYMSEHYKRVIVFGDQDEIWERDSPLPSTKLDESARP
jgi:hypothetical protein